MADYMSTPEGVVERLYAAISFEPGRNPNYNLLHAMFHANARISPPSTDTGGEMKTLSVKEFVEHFNKHIEDIRSIGGKEEQISCRTEVFHKVAHVFSAYHFTLVGASEPIARGVNSFQLVYENGRWWILSLTWDRAEPDEELKL